MLDWKLYFPPRLVSKLTFKTTNKSPLFKKVKVVFCTPWIMDILRRFPFGIYLLRILAQIMRSPSYFEKYASEILDILDGDSERGFNWKGIIQTHRWRNNWPVSDLSFRGLRNFEQYFGLYHLPTGREPECTGQIKTGDQGSSQEKPWKLSVRPSSWHWVAGLCYKWVTVTKSTFGSG